MKTLSAMLFAILACTALAEDAPKWVPISDGLIAELTAAGKKVTGPFALTAGITVDAAGGDVYMVVSGPGLWKSTDQGATFKQVGDKLVTGRCETGFSLIMDPAGKRLMCFMIYGNCARTLDQGATFQASKLAHLDYGAINWADPEAKRMIAIKHESGGDLVLTDNGGAEWKSLGKGFNICGLIGDVLISSNKEGIVRSTDSGATWTKVADFKPAGKVVYVRDGKGYITTDAGIYTTADQGQTWTVLGTPIKALQGPYFGKDEKHLVVATKEGLMETLDAGATWKLAAPLPPEFKHGLVGPCYGFDAARNIFYASSMGKPAYKLQR